MNKPAYFAALIIMVVASFFAGQWFSRRGSSSVPTSSARKVLYYVDPMHPSYKSDKPGVAPDCGMQLEPVYEDGVPAASAGGSGAPPGTIEITSERQQLIGLRIAPVENASLTPTVRVLGRVVTDQTRIYRLNAAVEGWVRDVTSDAEGSLVKKDQLLASFYAPEFQGAQQAYLFALGALDRFQASGKETPEQIALTNASIQSAADSLRSLGMTDVQVAELRKQRQVAQQIDIRSPANGFILTRNISLGQRFEKGTEFYRIADLEHVWILADIFESDSPHFRPGARVSVRYGLLRRTFAATVSNVLPQFDPATRTLKLRLEADNPGFALRPDMFVDVEIPLQLGGALSVPSDAVIDTGLRKIVFVDRGNGLFEPRRVETGWRFADRVEITKGLMEGERIVVSGNFLVDSESRLRLTAMGLPEDHAVDPVCGMGVDPRKAGKRSEYKGQTYYFCSDLCKDKFDKNPGLYGGQGLGAGDQKAGARGQGSGVRTPYAAGLTKMAKDPACGMDVDITAPDVIKLEYQGKTYYFCSHKCRDDFVKEPARYLKAAESSAPEPQADYSAPQTRNDVSARPGPRSTVRAKKRGQPRTTTEFP